MKGSNRFIAKKNGTILQLSRQVELAGVEPASR